MLFLAAIIRRESNSGPAKTIEYIYTDSEVSVPNDRVRAFAISDELKLVLMGEVYRPGDKFHGVRPEVMIAEPQKPGADRAVS